MFFREIKLFVCFSLQGWQEVHQACRNGLVAHLEQLLYYGAELNARNASGNTPLHVCAVNNQESCARTLLFRGADKNALNFAGQTPYQVRLEKKNTGNSTLKIPLKKVQFDILDIRYGIFREIEFPVLLRTETKKFY